MNGTDIAKKIYKTSHLTGKFVLRSGAVSKEYFDKYQFESNPELLKEIADKMVDRLPLEFDVVAGLEMGGIPLATMVSQITGKPLAFVRKKAKEYGTMRIAEGASIGGKRVVVIEDVVTSAGQIVLSVQELRARGAKVDVAVCVIDREAGGENKLAGIGIELRHVFTMSEIKESVGKK